MWQILLAISIFSPSKLSNAQENKPKDPPPQITYFLAEDKVAPEEVKFRDNSVWQLVLPCRATGSNPLEWVWKHNDVEINKFKFQFNNNWELSSDGTLRAKGLNISDSGTYQCFVQDTVTKVSTFSRKLRVKVTAVGDFKSKEGFTKSTKLGEPLNVACPQRGPSFGATFAWTSKKARSIQFPISNRVAIDPSTGNLHIMYITQEDVTDINTNFDGIRCTISAANTFYDSGAFTLQILPGKNTKLSSPSFTPSTSSSNEKAVEGRTKDLYCEATARPPPTLVWKKDGVVIKSGEDFIEIPEAFEGRLLSITSVKESSHETIFTCEASNNQTIASGPAKRNFNLDVEVAPRWTSKAPDSLKEIPISSNGTLSCDVYAQPEPVIKWYRDGTEITQSSAKIEVSGSKLLFKDITLDKAGIYQCSAENVHGMIVSSTYVKVLAIAPSFRNGFGPFYLFQDSEGRLKCEPEAAPRPSAFKWFDENGAEIKSGVNGYTIEQDGTLVISKVERNQHAGKFSCYAENFLGNATDEGMATVYDKTRIVLGPSDLSVNEGTRVDLRCEAEADSSLELHYTWKRDDAIIEYNRRVQWLRDQNVLTIADLTVEDAGIYTCVAYTPQPKYSEAKASAIVNIAGAPFPPTNLMLSSDCQNRNTTLSWVTGESNNASILYFLIERKSQYADDFWQVIANVTNPNATFHPLVKLAGNADLAFRIRAVNRFGPSRPSEPTGSFCRTIQAVPEKWPDNFRGVPGKAEELTIAWTAMRRVEWNGPGLYYKLWYRKVNSNDALVEVRREASSDSFVVPDAGYYVQWEFQIQAINEVGEGPKSPLVKQFSGQDPPEGKPEDVTVGTITARSVELSWKPVTITRGSVDGYRIYFWGESRVSVSAKRRRRAIPGYASVTNVTGVNTARYTVTELKPFFNYKFVITAYNSGGNGPESDEVAAATDEAAPGPPSNVQVFVFAKYILVTWQPPSEPNGVITDYRVGTETYTGSQPTEVTVNMQETGVEARRKLLRDLEPETNYVVEMQAATSKGWGTSFRKTEKTVAWAAPAKPEKPTVEGSAVDEVRVYYNFGLGGGYTHEFLVMFRKKLEGEGFLNTSWVDHFQQQSIIIGNLDPELYQFKTVARNDYPSKENPQESPASDITEARPLPGISNTGKRVSTPIYQSAWFIALLVLIALLLLILLIFVLYTRHQGAKYRVGKREKKRAAALIDREQFDEEEGPFSTNGRADHPPPYVSQGSLPRGQESDRDSLDDYGEGPQFNEDGSFIEEYGDEKKAPPEEKDPSSLATFV